MASRDIIWITLESVRQDHTSLDGHDRDTTPTLQRLAERADGASFPNCFSHGIWTRTSSASMLTGRAPAAHGVLSFDSKLPESVETIPEQLSDNGYRTACVSPIGQVSEATGLDRGFDDFHYLSRGTLLEEAGPLTMLRFLRNIRHHSAGLTTDTSKHSTGYLVTELAKRHIHRAGDGNDPLFLYTHIADSHHTYYPPKGWQETFAADLELPLDEALTVAVEMSDALIENIADGAQFTDAEWNAIEVLYDTCIRYVDHLVGEIVETAQAHLEDPLVVITADHGELFGERGCLAHMLVANTAVSNVPLVIAGIDGLEGNENLVQHADALQLVLEECNLSIPVPAGTDMRDSKRTAAITQRGGKRAQKKLRQIQQHNPAFDTSLFHRNDLTSVRTATHRYQYSQDREELFELPDEVTDRATEQPEVTDQLRRLTEEWLAEHGEPVETEQAEFSEQMQQQLEDLGYL